MFFNANTCFPLVISLLLRQRKDRFQHKRVPNPAQFKISILATPFPIQTVESKKQSPRTFLNIRTELHSIHHTPTAGKYQAALNAPRLCKAKILVVNLIYAIAREKRVVVIHTVPFKRGDVGKIDRQHTIGSILLPIPAKVYVQARRKKWEHAELYKEQHIQCDKTI